VRFILKKIVSKSYFFILYSFFIRF